MNQIAEVSLQSIWSLLSDLSIESKKWLIGMLNEDIEKNTNSSPVHECLEKKLDFPKLPKDFKVSQEVLDNVLGPLPDGLDCDKLTEFSEIDRLKDSLDKCRPLTEGEVARLRDEFLTEYIYNSNAIEGNTLTLRETALVLQGMTIDKKPLKDHLEAVGHRDAYNYIEMVATQKDPLDKRVIKEIHSLVLLDRPMDRGVFRKIPVQIMGAYVTPADPWDIEPKLDDLLKKYTNEYHTLHIVERIARFHLEFEGIHPFIDGNGRTGRLLMNLDLIQHGYPPIDVKYTDRVRYYDAFDNYYRDEQIDTG